MIMSLNLHYFFRRVLLYAFSIIPLRMPAPSDEEIDVIIPITKKDLKILPYCLDGVKRNVTNKIRQIFVVSALDEEILLFCKRNDIVFIDEEGVLGFGPKDVNLFVKGGYDRSGWLFQQLIKLSGTIGTCNNYLCIDSDHVLIRDHTFLTNRNKFVFYMSSEYHQPYYNIIRRISSLRYLSPLSYVAHKMIFNKEQVLSLQNEIEKNTGKIWYEGVLDYYDRNEGAGFSEFELYGNFCFNKIFRPWRQKLLSYDKLKSFEELCELYESKYISLTFPDYVNS